MIGRRDVRFLAQYLDVKAIRLAPEPTDGQAGDAGIPQEPAERFLDLGLQLGQREQR
ncbi:hypothetical protein D3C83_233640 [compost metagenome]